VGTVCTDGSVYAELSPDGNVRMYTQRCDVGMSWSGSACTGTRSTIVWSTGFTIQTFYGSFVTGKANTAGLYPLSNADSPYTAAIDCHALNEDGHTDWYLPALNELNVMYTGAAAIGNFGDIWKLVLVIVRVGYLQWYVRGYSAPASCPTAIRPTPSLFGVPGDEFYRGINLVVFLRAKGRIRFSTCADRPEDITRVFAK
jgi:hypothetical protein